MYLTQFVCSLHWSGHFRRCCQTARSSSRCKIDRYTTMRKDLEVFWRLSVRAGCAMYLSSWPYFSWMHGPDLAVDDAHAVILAVDML